MLQNKGCEYIYIDEIDTARVSNDQYAIVERTGCLSQLEWWYGLHIGTGNPDTGT